MTVKELVIIGDKGNGKTTLANALLGWDILPQSNEGWYMPTKKNDSRMLTDGIRLTDTPGYELWRSFVPEDVIRAVSRADTLIVMLPEALAEEEIDLPAVVPDWEAGRSAKEALLKGILAHARTRDIYFVLPFCWEDWPEGRGPLEQGLRLGRACLASLSDHGPEGFFCIDPMMALVGTMEEDYAAQARSGILPLKDALNLRGEKGDMS